MEQAGEEGRSATLEPGADLLALAEVGNSRRCWSTRRGSSSTAPARWPRSIGAWPATPPWRCPRSLTCRFRGCWRPVAHLYLWVPNALLAEGLQVMTRWGFTYKTNLVWYKVRQDGGPDRRGVGFYFRNVTELVLFGTRGANVRTLPPGRRMPNLLLSRKREHSRKPDQLYDVIEACSPAPWLELFARHPREGWTQWGDGLFRQASTGVAHENAQVGTACG